jgi:hypothetical protein
VCSIHAPGGGLTLLEGSPVKLELFSMAFELSTSPLKLGLFKVPARGPPLSGLAVSGSGDAMRLRSVAVHFGGFAVRLRGNRSGVD